jgi:hypothetical protein
MRAFMVISFRFLALFVALVLQTAKPRGTGGPNPDKRRKRAQLERKLRGLPPEQSGEAERAEEEYGDEDYEETGYEESDNDEGYEAGYEEGDYGGGRTGPR